MPTNHRRELKRIRRFDQLVAYLRDEMDWPIGSTDFEDLVFEYTPEELGIDPKNAAKIQEIKRLRPLSTHQPWGIFFVKFEPKRLPVVALRRILSQVALKKRASANSAERQAWETDDLLFISNYGEGEERQISFAHFSQSDEKTDLPTLKVLGWDNRDTPLHLDHVGELLTERLAWPEDDGDSDEWRRTWRSAFTLRHREVIQTSRQLSERLAELARAIRDRIETALSIETDSGPLTQLMKAFQQSLVHDLDEDGFADMYAQTITYGLLSSRIADPQKSTAEDFATHMRTNPFLKELMETFLHVGGRKGKAGGPGIDFDELGVADVIDLLDDAKMEEVVRDFGDSNPQEDPVIHFYELFLTEYDAKKRTQRGVFYTPRPVVSFIVRAVDELLRSSYELKDGLADTASWADVAKRNVGIEVPNGIDPDSPFVQILDPATGTGTFLVETIGLIHDTMRQKWKLKGHNQEEILELWNRYVPAHLLPRLHGYELMMAPYSIAHMKVGLKLLETGYLFGNDQRAQIYLTNALEPPTDVQYTLDFIPALAHEVQAVNTVKRDRLFTVVIGNPPYSIQSQNLDDIHRQWSDRYRYVDGERIRERGALQFEKALQDDFVKFASLSQEQVEKSGCGVVGVIMSHSFVDNPTLRGMRYSLLSTFDDIRVVDLHGNLTRKEKCPDGSPDQNVFDIRQGVAILLGTSTAPIEEGADVLHVDLWGTRQSKYDVLLDSSVNTLVWHDVDVASPFYLLKPQSANTREEFENGIKITDAFKVGSVGIITARDNVVVDFDADPLVERASYFRDSTESHQAVCDHLRMSLKKGWDIQKARERIKQDEDLSSFIRSLCYRPFDNRLVFYHPSLVWGMSYPTMQHMLGGDNLAMMVGRSGQVIGQGEWDIAFCTRTLSEFNLFRRGGHNLFPLYLKWDENSPQAEINSDTGFESNLTEEFQAAFGFIPQDKKSSSYAEDIRHWHEDVFSYIYALIYSPAYRDRYAEFLKLDFPRVFLPGTLQFLEEMALIGRKLVNRHLLEFEYGNVSLAKRVGTGQFQVEKVSYEEGTVWIDKRKSIGFTDLPEHVWDFHIGGYRICEKWLKDRQAKGGKNARPGRVLEEQDIGHYQKIVCAIDDTIRLMGEIDEIIQRHGGWPDAFAQRSLERTQDLFKAAEDSPRYQDN